MQNPMIALAVAAALAAPAPAQVVGAAGAAARGIPGAPAGPALNFNLNPVQLQARYQEATLRLDSALAAVAAVPPGSVTFANTVKAFEEATSAWARELGPIQFLTAVAPDPAIRAAANEVEKKMSVYAVSLSHREDLYRQFERAAAAKEALDPADAKLLETTVKSFRENGFALAPEQREKLKAMQERLSDLSSEFGRNIDERKDSLTVGEDGIKGLPADFVATLDKTADGRYVVPVDEPSLVSYMRYAQSAEHRKAMLTKFDNRGGEKNLEILHEALGLRRDVAKLLGYPGYPEMVMKDRMAGSPERVYEFLNRVKDAVVERARKDLGEVLEIKRRDDPEATQVFAWERMFYARKLREEKYALDNEQVKPYFPVDRVVEGTMKVYQRVLGVTFREAPDGPKWADGVRLFEISDTKSGKRIGHFYLDLVPRDGKHGHPAAYPIVSGRALADGSYEAPVSAMVADFPKAAPGKPSLLSHADVETFFHEFGHLMHQTLTKARYASFSGSSVALDFVEAPSQMLENFIWERNVLDELSGHWQTGAKLPQDLYEKMLAARTFMEGASYAGQVAYALGDLVLHASVPDDVSAAFDKIIADITGVPTVEGTHFVGSFDHLMGGYGAGYYAYLWSKVFAQDIYTVFKADGVISPAVGARYRQEILEVGSERPEMDSLRAFLGREPSEKAFMDEIRGVSAPAEFVLILDRRWNDADHAALEQAGANVLIGTERAGKGEHTWRRVVRVPRERLEELRARIPGLRIEERALDGAGENALRLSARAEAAYAAAYARVGGLPEGVEFVIMPHYHEDNPQILIRVDGRVAYHEYLYHSESNLARLRRKWWNPLTWLGPRRPSDDLSKRFEAALRLAVEGSASVRARRAAAEIASR